MSTTQCLDCGRKFAAAMHDCPFCGAARPPKPGGNELACPVCRRSFGAMPFADETVAVCEQCLGLWLDRPQLEKLTSSRSAMLDPSVPYNYERRMREPRSGYVPCPHCGDMMTRQNFGAISGVIIDICGSHGAWFDAGELERVRAFVASGGHDRAQDHKIEANRDALDGLRSDVGSLELMENMMHHWDKYRLLFRGKP